MRIATALRPDGAGMRVPIRVRLLPPRAPARGAGRQSPLADRATGGDIHADVAPAEETQPGVIEIVVVELVDQRAGAAGGEEGVEPSVGEKRAIPEFAW